MLYRLHSHRRVIEPLVFGDYPRTMKKSVGSRLPSFTKSESELVKGAFDFIGLNHYSTAYIEDDSGVPRPNQREFNTDMFVKFRRRIKSFLPCSNSNSNKILRVFLARYNLIRDVIKQEAKILINWYCVCSYQRWHALRPGMIKTVNQSLF